MRFGMTSLDWIDIETMGQLDSAVSRSFSIPVLIYKHSTRCGLRNIVRSRLEKSWENAPIDVECYFVDLIANRPISDAIENLFMVPHQSPQVLLLIDGNCVFHSSHMGVNYQAIKHAVNYPVS